MDKSKHRIADLEREIKSLTITVGELLRELDALRTGLADEITTKRLLVVGDDCTTRVTPGHIDVSHDATGCHALLHVLPNNATLGVVAGDTVHALPDERMTVWLEATRDWGVVGESDKRAAVEVNGVELTVPQPVS